MCDESVDIHSNTLVSTFARKLNAKYNLLHAPIMVDSKEAKDVIMSQHSVRKIFDFVEQAHIALVGIGGTPKTFYNGKSYLGNELMESFEKVHVVGDICSNFIDKYGRPAKHFWNDQVIALDLERLKKIPTVIGVAAGKERFWLLKQL